MQIHELKPKTSFKKAKRVGRGGKKGTYSGKGQKGQKSRAGTRFQPLVREWLKKYHKLRGYRFGTQGKEIVNLNLNDLKNILNLEKQYSKTSLEKIIKKGQSRVKILAKGNLTKSLIVENCTVSKKAKEIIEKGQHVK